MAGERKITILYWIVAILAVFNISLLVTILFFPKTEFQGPNMHQNRREMRKEGDRRSYFARELNLSPSQEVIFDSSRLHYFREADTLFKALGQCRKEIYQELSSAQPDTNKLNMLATRVGSLQSQLKISTIRHFMKLRMDCTPEQQQKLSQMFGRMINN